MKKWLTKCLIAVIVLMPLSDVALAADMITVKLSNYIGNKTSIKLIPSVNYSIDGSANWLTAGQTYQATVKKDSTKTYIQVTNGTTVIANVEKLVVTPSSTLGYVDMEGRKYLGKMTFQLESGYLRPYNQLDFEMYLKGVVPVEMSNSWGTNGGLESLKAQAVAARTYAKKGNYINQSYITDTQSHQVYGGYFPTFTYSNNAVDATKGQVVTYNKALIGTYYSSSNGGTIESNRGAWGSTLLPYFTSKADPFDPINPFTYSISETDLITKVKGQVSGYTIKNITSVARNGYTDGNHTKNVTFKVVTTTGDVKTFDITADKLRSLLGASNIKSTYLNNPTKSGTTFTFTGKGFGHGVGMSQYGALKMAQSGYDYKNILGFYYQGTQLFNGSSYSNLIFTSKEPTAPTAPISTENVSNFNVSYTYPTLTISFDTAESGNLDVTLETTDGKQVVVFENKTKERWEGSGSKKYTLTDTDLLGTYKVKVRHAVSATEITNKEQTITMSNPTPKLTSASIAVSGNVATFTYGTSKPSRVLIDLEDLKGNRVSVVEPYVLKSNGQYSVKSTLSQLSGTYKARIQLVDDNNKIYDKYEKNISIKTVVPTYSTGMHVATLNKNATLYTNEAKTKVLENVLSTDKMKVILKKGSLYQVEYNGQTGFVDSKYMQMSKGKDIGLTIDGYKVNMEEKPKIVKNTTLVPIRWVSDGLGVTVSSWNNKTKTATLKKGSTTISLTIGKNYGLVNGKKVPLDVSVSAYDGRTYVPLRFVGEQTNSSVSWDSPFNMIWIKK